MRTNPFPRQSGLYMTFLAGEALFLYKPWSRAGRFALCQGGDSNPYGFLHQILSLARLPIPPPRQWIFDCRFSIADCNKRRSQAAANAFASVYGRGGVLAAGSGEACTAAADLAAAALAAASAAAFFFASAAAAASARPLSTDAASTGWIL
jgi:hypothetical protein